MIKKNFLFVSVLLFGLLLLIPSTAAQNLIVDKDVQFNIPNGNVRVIFSENLYADRILIYNDNIEFENVYMDDQEFSSLTLGAENADNMRVTSINSSNVKLTVNAPSGTESIVTLKGRVKPILVRSNGSKLAKKDSYSTLTSGVGWYYDGRTLWIRSEHSSPNNIILSYGGWSANENGTGHWYWDSDNNWVEAQIENGWGSVEWYQDLSINTTESRYTVKNVTTIATWRIENSDNLVSENVRVTITDPSGTEHIVKEWTGQNSTTSWTTMNENVDGIVDSLGTYRFSLKVEAETNGPTPTITQWDNAQLKAGLNSNVGVDIQTGVDSGATVAFATVVLIIVVMVFVMMIGVIKML